MVSKAKNKYIRISPYKLRPIVDLIRGFSVGKAISWLKAYPTKRIGPIVKTLLSAYSNASNDHSDIISMEMLFIKEIKIDQGPTVTYFKPGAMGKASVQQKRMCHLEIGLDRVKNKAKVT